VENKQASSLAVLGQGTLQNCLYLWVVKAGRWQLDSENCWKVNFRRLLAKAKRQINEQTARVLAYGVRSRRELSHVITCNMLTLKYAFYKIEEPF